MNSGEILLCILATTLGGAILVLAVLTVALRGHEDTWFVSFCRAVNAIYTRVFHRIRVPAEPLPTEGGCIVVANHQGGADPCFLAASTSRWIRFLMAREYYEMRFLNWAFRGLGAIPVRRETSDPGSFRAALRVLADGGVLGVFPQGGIRPDDREIGAGKDGVALLALRTGTPIVPLYIAGAPAHDNVLIGLLKTSRTRVWAGEPIRTEASRKPSRDEVARLTESVLESLRDLKARSEAERDAEGDAKRVAA